MPTNVGAAGIRIQECAHKWHDRGDYDKRNTCVDDDTRVYCPVQSSTRYGPKTYRGAKGYYREGIDI